MTLSEIIVQRLAILEPLQLKLEDDSAKHAGHAGAASGGGHFNLTITSASFSGLNAINRHRMIYSLLTDLMPQQIHALSVKAYSPEERAEFSGF